MGEQIKTKVQQIGRTARLLVWGWAICLLFASVVAVLLVFGAIDYLFRQQDVGMRYVVFTGAIAAIGISFVRLCRALFAARFSDLDVAQLIERRVAGLGDRLSSALSFLKQHEQLASPATSHSAAQPAAQSFAMQRAVIKEANQRLAAVNASDVFDYRAFQRAALLSFLALAVVLVISVIDLQTVLIGTQRVLAPWSDVSWPRRNELYFKNRVDKLAQGSEFVAVVKDSNDHLPDRVKFEFAFLDQDVVQVRDMNRLNDSVVFRLDNITRSFRYRAIGGDDQTNWYEIEVLPAPRIEQIEFHVKPPAYSQLPPRTFTEDVKAIVGSSLELTARSSEQLREASVRWAVDGREFSFPARIDSDGKTLKFPVSRNAMSIESSGVLRLEIINENALVGGLNQKFQIVAIPDVPPTIDVASSDSLSAVTIQGKIRLHVSAREDVRLEQVDLSITTQGSPTGKQRTLFRRDGSKKALAALINERESGLGERFETDVDLDVNTIDNVQVGEVITLFVTATDAKQQTAVSNKLSFRIADAAELVEQLLGKQSQVYEKLLEALRQQNKSIKQLESVRLRLDAEQQADANDGNALYAAQLAETEVARKLSDPQNGAAALLEQILHECLANAIDRPQFVSQIEASYREVKAIVDGPLANSQFRLASAIRLTKQDDANLLELQKLLEQIAEQQVEVATRLEKLVGQFSQIDALREAIKTWIQLRRQQDEITGATKALSAEAVGKSFDQLSTENRQRIVAQAAGQNELARNTQQATWELDRLAKQFEESSAESRMIGEARQLIAELLVDAQMRQTSEDIRKNQLGKAVGQQQQIVQSLDRILQVLQGSRSADNNKIEQAVQAKDAVNQLLRQQSEITAAIKKMQSANEQDRKQLLPDAEDQQRKIAGQLQQLRDRLQTNENHSAAKQAGESGRMATETAEKINEQDLTEAENSSQQTERLLQQLQKTLDQQIQQEQSRQNELRNNQAKALVNELIEQQRNLSSRFSDYQALQEAEKLTNRPRLQQFSVTERELSEATQRLVEGFADQIAVSYVLSQVVDHLDTASELLGQSRADEETEYAIDAALAGLERVGKALDRKVAASSQQNTAPDQNQTDQPPPQIAAAEIALLLESQQSINDRTARIELSRAENGGELNEQLTAEIKRLADQEAELAKIVMHYLDKMQSAGNEREEEKPSIPDLPIPELPIPELPNQ